MTEAEALLRQDRTDNAPLYERDFHAWLIRQAELVRSGQLTELDRENLAEELETLGRAERNEIESRLKVLLTHLLKWQFQPGLRGTSWAVTIENQRDELTGRIGQSPSLWTYPAEVLNIAYRRARREAVKEIGLSRSSFPESCLYSVENILDPNFLPGRIDADGTGELDEQ